MPALQFDAEIHDGMLSLPPSAKGTFEGPVHVILVKGEADAEDDFIAELIASPVDAPDFVPLTREAAADSEPDNEKRKARYRETEEVKTYYRVNRYPR